MADENVMFDSDTKARCAELPSNLVQRILEIATKNHESCVLNLCISVCKTWSTEAKGFLVRGIEENLRILDSSFLDTLDETRLTKKQIQVFALERLVDIVASRTLARAQLFVNLGGVPAVLHSMRRMADFRRHIVGMSDSEEEDPPMMSDGDSSEDEDLVAASGTLTVKSLDARGCEMIALCAGCKILRFCMDLAERSHLQEADDGIDAEPIENANADWRDSSIAAKTGKGGAMEKVEDNCGEEDEDEVTLEREREQNVEVLHRYKQVLSKHNVRGKQFAILLDQSKQELEERVAAFGRDWGCTAERGLQAQTHSFLQKQLEQLKKLIELMLANESAEDMEQAQSESVEMQRQMQSMKRQTQQHLQQLLRLQDECEAARDPVQTVRALGGVGLVLSRMMMYKEFGQLQLEGLQFLKSMLNTGDARAAERLHEPGPDKPILLAKKKRYHWTRGLSGKMRFHYGYSSSWPGYSSGGLSDLYSDVHLDFGGSVVHALFEILEAHGHNQRLHSVALSFLDRFLRFGKGLSLMFVILNTTLNILPRALKYVENDPRQVCIAGRILVHIAKLFLTTTRGFNSRTGQIAWRISDQSLNFTRRVRRSPVFVVGLTSSRWNLGTWTRAQIQPSGRDCKT